jgi:hypothetical protein
MDLLDGLASLEGSHRICGPWLDIADNSACLRHISRVGSWNRVSLEEIR